MDRFLKSNLNANGRLTIACILSILLVITIALAGCDATSAKEKAKSKNKKAKQVEATSTDDSESSNSSGSSSATTSDKDKEKSKDNNKEKSKNKDKSKNKQNESSSSSTTATKQKVWVPEQGHYEQVKVLKCKCGHESFSQAEHDKHRNDYIAEKRKTDPNFECTGEHLPKRWITKSVWKVDVPGHYEYR